MAHRTAKPETRDEQIICQAELAVVPLAISTWSSYLKSREVLLFIDNNPAKDALVHGVSSSAASSEMVRITRLLCAELASAPWFDRVPSPSNLADDPSRAEESKLLELGASRISPVCPALLKFEIC